MFIIVQENLKEKDTSLERDFHFALEVKATKNSMGRKLILTRQNLFPLKKLKKNSQKLFS